MSRRRIVTVTVIALAAFAAVFHVAHQQRMASNELRDAGGAFFRNALLPRAYAQAHDGLWPPLDAQTQAFALPLGAIPRGYTLDARFNSKTVAPVPAMLLGRINNAGAYTLAAVDSAASNYIYFGFAVTNDAEFAALADAIRNGAPVDRDIPVASGSGTFGSATLYRLREDLGKTLAADGVIESNDPEALARIPMLMERPHNGYAWVMYASRTVERVPFPGAFPMTQAVVEAAAGLAAAP